MTQSEAVRYLEVRCCCRPEKLLGYLPAPLDGREGSVVTFTITRPGVRFRASARLGEDPITYEHVPGRFVRLPIAALVEGYAVEEYGFLDSPEERLAFSSDETPIDVLREIPGFRDASSPP